jgi:hypothetical protein
MRFAPPGFVLYRRVKFELEFVGGFSERQSLVLALVVTLIYSIFRSIEGFPHAPFHMTLTPNLHAIATDFELVENTAEAGLSFKKRGRSFLMTHRTPVPRTLAFGCRSFLRG